MAEVNRRLAEGADGAEMIEVPILAGDTPEALAARVLAEEHRLYPAILAEFARR